LIAEVTIKLRVAVSGYSESPALTRSTSRMYESIFPSYSRNDTAIMEELEQAYKALGLRYLRDIHELRSGEPWSSALLAKIDEADIFQLCWSRNSSRSVEVERNGVTHFPARSRISFDRCIGSALCRLHLRNWLKSISRFTRSIPIDHRIRLSSFLLRERI